MTTAAKQQGQIACSELRPRRQLSECRRYGSARRLTGEFGWLPRVRGEGGDAGALDVVVTLKGDDRLDGLHATYLSQRTAISIRHFHCRSSTLIYI